MKIAIIGTGAMGSIYAGLLADAGHEVTAVDLWRAHIDAIQTEGLRVEGASGDRIVRRGLDVATGVGETGRFDLIIIATKANEVTAAVESILPILTDDTIVLAMQNGVGSGARVSKLVDQSQIMLGIAGGFGASMKGPGHVHHNGMAMLNICELRGGETERLQKIVALWHGAGFNAKGFANTDQLMWEKLICNCTFSAPCTIFGYTVRQALNNPEARHIALSCGIEAWETAHALGVPITFDDPEAYLLNFAQGVLNAHPSMMHDHLAQRHSEIDFINGAIPVAAEEIGRRAPYNEVTSAIIRAREADFPPFMAK